MRYTYTCRGQNPSDSTLRRHFLHQFARLWPAIKGSLAEIRKPCIRPNCPACARGDKHPAFLLSFTDKGRRRCMYVPAELVPPLQQALRNGKALEAPPINWGLSCCVSTASSVTPRLQTKPYEFQLTYCPGCLKKQLVIDQWQEEIVRLKAKLRYQERTAKEGPFGSLLRVSSPQSQHGI